MVLFFIGQDLAEQLGRFVIPDAFGGGNDLPVQLNGLPLRLAVSSSGAPISTNTPRISTVCSLR
jgi:hypothetical protein